MKTRIEVKNENKKIYDIVIDTSFNALKEELAFLDLSKKKVCIVTESHVAPFYLKEIADIIGTQAKEMITFSFTAGEAHKQLKTVEHLYEQLIQHHFERQDVLIALGGGVVGDLTGFAAATYLRGIDFIQIPTTLLAQVDSSIGGKTGVDMMQYKNMVGAFHQPKLVYINVNTLTTLPEREFYSGMGEVIKHGMIQDKEYYQWIIDHISQIQSRDLSVLSTMIEGSCHIKRRIVEADPKEKGERALLNFGHTLGHAIEKLEFFSWLHGECVGVGCLLATAISVHKGDITKEEFNQAKEVFSAFKLDKDISNLSVKEIIETTKLDKKMENDQIKFILLRQIGEAYIDRTVSEDDMKCVLEEWMA